MNKVYLAGPIGGLTYGESTDWRESVKRELAEYGISAFSPMRGKEFLNDGEKIDASVKNYTDIMATSKGIMTRDFFDARTANVILVNMAIPHEKPSLGTVMEIAWAHAFQIPLVLIDSDLHKYSNHPMIKEAIGFKAENMEQALITVRIILLP